MPAAEPITATIAASHAIMRRIWPGVAATARSSAISRSRCWIERPSVPATTNMAMNSASPPKAAVTGSGWCAPAGARGTRPAPRAAPVSTVARRPPAGAQRARDVEAGGREDADRVDAAGMPGQPRRLGVGEEDRALRGDGVARAGDADDRDRADGSGRGERQPRAEREPDSR